MSPSVVTDTAHSEEESRSSMDAPVAKKSRVNPSTAPTSIFSPLLRHLSCTSTARELVKLRTVSKWWKVLVDDYVRTTAEALKVDDTEDWYFPLRAEIHQENCLRTSDKSTWLCSCGRTWTGCWTWSGVHHSSGEIHSLPPVPSVPGFEARFDCLIASAGGLLLFIESLPCTQDEFDQPLPERLTAAASAAWLRHDRASFTPTSSQWRRLLVCNPLTKKWRILPALDPRQLGYTVWGYVGFRAHMVVEEKVNEYRVILSFRSFLLVYKSSSNSWTARRFPVPPEWGISSFFPFSREYTLGSSAVADGKLYFADLQVINGALPREFASDMMIRITGRVRVYEIDEQAGTWKRPVCYALKNYFPAFNRRNFWLDLGFRVGSYAIGVVECMGSLYAIIPAALDVHRAVEAETRLADDLRDSDPARSYRHFGYLALQFYVLQLCPGSELPCGQLLIRIPHVGHEGIDCSMESGCEYFRRRLSMMPITHAGCLEQNPRRAPSKTSTWFRCTARGSVIWVTFSDYLLQFDVVSRRSTTQVLPDCSFVPPPDLSYRPSFVMRP